MSCHSVAFPQKRTRYINEMTLRPTPQDRLYQPKRKLRKGNTYTRSRNKLEEVVNVLSASCKAEKQELEDAAAQELVSRLLRFVEPNSTAAFTGGGTRRLAASTHALPLPLR